MVLYNSFSSSVNVPYFIASLSDIPGIHLVTPILAAKADSLNIGVLMLYPLLLPYKKVVWQKMYLRFYNISYKRWINIPGVSDFVFRYNFPRKSYHHFLSTAFHQHANTPDADKEIAYTESAHLGMKWLIPLNPIFFSIIILIMLKGYFCVVFFCKGIDCFPCINIRIRQIGNPVLFRIGHF